MAKTLSESAAEILKASMNAGKEPMQTLGAEVNDLGGATPQDDYSGGPGHGQKDLDSSVGVAAAAAVKQAAKPGVEGAPAEPMKKAPVQAKKIGDEDEALKKNPVDGGTVKVEETEVEGEVVEEGMEGDAEKSLAFKKILKPGEKIGAMKLEADESEEEDEDEDKEDEMEDEKEDEEGDDEENMKKMKKEMVEKYRGSMREDVDALFNGESLSEDFKIKATLIFETAVQSRVEKIVEDVLSENDAILAEAIEEIKSQLSEQVDEYLNYVVEEWVKDNQVAIETGLRAELAEDFIAGLKALFEEHYVEIPEEKVDIAEELAVKVVELEEASAKTSEELTAKVASLTEELNAIKKEKAITLACEGLTQVQAEKIKSLAESVEFTTEGDFNNKLAIIRENYFPSKINVKSEVKAIQETAVEEPEVEKIHDVVMSRYVQALTKTAPKA